MQTSDPLEQKRPLRDSCDSQHMSLCWKQDQSILGTRLKFNKAENLGGLRNINITP
jgi:hypothetical protein